MRNSHLLITAHNNNIIPILELIQLDTIATAAVADDVDATNKKKIYIKQFKPEKYKILKQI